MKIDKQFEELVEQTMAEWHTPGLCMMVLHEDEVVYGEGFGYRDLSTGEKVNTDSLFVAASTTKAFTATALGMLAEEGRFNWHTPLREYLPQLRLADALTERNITAVDLLSHRTGYPRHDKVWFGQDKTRQELIDALQFLEPNCAFRSVWQYNNLMYVLAGHLVEVLADTTWENFLHERILKPLGMKRSNFSVTEMQTMDNVAQGYAWNNNQYERAPLRFADHIGPAGSLNTSGNDMARWIQLQMGLGYLGESRIVSESTLAKVHTPIMVAPSFLPGRYEEILHTQYGLGWFSEVYRGNQIIYHVGNLDGFYALVSFMPSHRFGHVILSNMTPNRAPYVLSYSLYDRYLGLPSIDWNKRIREKVEQQEQNELRIKEMRKKERIPNTDPSYDLSEYEGKYCHPAYGEIRIQQRDATLYLVFGEFTARLVHFHYDVFMCEGPEKGFPGLMLATFLSDGRGHIRRISVPFEPAAGASEIIFNKISG